MASSFTRTDPESILGGLVFMEEERYLRTVAAALDATQLYRTDVREGGHGYPYALFVRPIGHGPDHEFDFYVAAGADAEFKMQIVDLSNGKADTFIDVPFDRPFTTAYIVHRHIKSTYPNGVKS